jgi:hypothetical protein
VKIRRRIVTDGITAQAQVTFAELDRPMSRAEAQQMVAALERAKINASFEVKIREIEPELREDLAQPSGRYGSRRYYADVMLETIAKVRELRDMGQTDAALAMAMRLGYLGAECLAKEWPDLALGRAHHARQRDKARALNQAKRRGNADLLAAADAYRQTHPTLSEHALAARIGPQFGLSIDACRMRLARARKYR